MGYSREWIRKVLDKALVGYERILFKTEKGLTNRNRVGKDTSFVRRYKKILKHKTGSRKGK